MYILFNINQLTETLIEKPKFSKSVNFNADNLSPAFTLNSFISAPLPNTNGYVEFQQEELKLLKEKPLNPKQFTLNSYISEPLAVKEEVLYNAKPFSLSGFISQPLVQKEEVLYNAKPFTMSSYISKSLVQIS